MDVLAPKQYSAMRKVELTFYFFSSLDPTYVKAIHRRATARVALQRVADAVSDFEKVLQLEPSNKTAKMEMDKLKQEQQTKTKEV